jgi:hypothetical protein
VELKAAIDTTVKKPISTREESSVQLSSLSFSERPPRWIGYDLEGLTGCHLGAKRHIGKLGSDLNSDFEDSIRNRLNELTRSSGGL